MKNDEKNEVRLMDCACLNLRMATRRTTQYYDNALKSAGLKSPQFSLLNIIALRAEGFSVNEIAQNAMLDQTTVTRNIEMLRKKAFVEIETEELDSRRKRVKISEGGKAALKAAMPLWEEAQRELQKTVGKEEYTRFLEVLNILKNVEL